ncbi:helix-turn-helix domain-containing protein [Spirosoma rigui]|uniref:helix-turn-helix domain-containing protein n=1 Tax=Spirosoma rigui TaxID=564064 RepID=UPI0009B08C6D|nr:AraC family transcriptional regulator [Spirosoma rigui]
MTFYFSPYSTPLLFGFVQAWVYAILLWLRGYREERLSDKLLGWVLVGCALNIWEYMLGFGGIEILWRELEFFPRSLGYLFPVLCYFYLKSQFNAGFRFGWRDLWHTVPFLIFTLYHVSVFAMGHDAVLRWEETVHHPYHIANLEFAVGVAIDLLYLYWSLQLYQQYRAWIKTQFSETDSISFRWFRNFLLMLTITAFFSYLMTTLSLTLRLNFFQDWWDELFEVVLIYYLSINGYAQTQSVRRLTFHAPPSADTGQRDTALATVSLPLVLTGEEQGQAATQHSDPGPPAMSDELLRLREKLTDYMISERPYLEPELSLADLSRRLHTNPVILSQVINAGLGKNFNDFINEYRVDAFKRQVLNPANTHLSFLGIALDCGFNSKATFNRAFRKFTGQSPGEFLTTQAATR